MPKRLLVVESPGKVKKLSQILGADWIVRASCEHIRELSNEDELMDFIFNFLKY